MRTGTAERTGRLRSAEDVLPGFSLLETPPLHEKVYVEIRRAIISGKLRPGQRLTIRGLAAALGTSAMPVREALRGLVTMQALEVRPNRTLAVPPMTREKFEDLSEVRAKLEGLAAERAARKISSAELATLRELCDGMVAATKRRDAETYLAKNQEFHFTICRAARSAVLMPIIETLWLQLGPYLNLYADEAEVPTRADRNHRAVIGALSRGDSRGARAAIVKDIVEGAEYVVRRNRFADDREGSGFAGARGRRRRRTLLVQSPRSQAPG